MPRMLFEKKGKAIWISHLDLMRLFQRAFKRAGLPLTHTHGFNPRASVSIALPLSVGVESCCELLDFDLDTDSVCIEQIKDKLNQSLVEGVRVLDVYSQGRKLRELTNLHCAVTLEYDTGVPDGAVEQITELFARPSLVVPKKTKSGIQDQDIIPMIQSMEVSKADDNTLVLDSYICCQNPTLNPAQLALAIELHLPEYKADFTKCRRIEVYDQQKKIFR